MDVYLAGQWPWKEKGIYEKSVVGGNLCILDSFYYADALTEKYIPYFKKFLLDSGAFTFMMQKKKSATNWDDYVERFADFIIRNNVQHYFELDIDKIVGLKEVERLRHKLENRTGRQCIPVWHKSRGKEDFIRICREYPYVALGGLVGSGGAGSSAYSAKLQQFFPWFIDTAHEHGAKIHALGFTSLDGLRKYHFDSVDSTAWLSGNRFGSVYFFDGRTMQSKSRQKNEKMTNVQSLAVHNFNEWVKFQKYAETHL